MTPDCAKTSAAGPATSRRPLGLAMALLLLALGLARPALAARAPVWVDNVKDATLPTFPGHPAAVVLYRYRSITVDANGKEEYLNRVVYRILRPEGIDATSILVLGFNSQRPVKYLHAWGVPAQGKVIELNNRDAVEVSPFSYELYADQRAITLRVPGMHVGDLVAFEWERKGRQELSQDEWLFQDDFPVLDTRLDLQLPSGWEYRTAWIHHAPLAPLTSGGTLTWELHNLPAVENEPAMPQWRAVAAWMGLTYLSPGAPPNQGPAGRSWQDVAQWQASLTAPQLQPSPQIQQKVAALTAGKASLLNKIEAVSTYVQHQIRYVAVEIGIGGYQPHPAASIYSNLYGDCKDKATLLSSMLQVLGVHSWLVMVHSERGVVAPQFPSPLNFDHVILAIQLPDDPAVNGLFAVRDDPVFGKILFFDPTDQETSFGSLPSVEQGSYGLISDATHGKLVPLPVLPPAVNRLLRIGNFRLLPDGTLAGAVKELSWGVPAADLRGGLLSETQAQQTRDLQQFLGNFFTNVDLRAEKVTDEDPNMSVEYSLVAPQYASQAGDLLLVRPCIIGERAEGLRTDKPRQYPVSFESTTLQSDMFTIALPPGYAVDELPPPVDVNDGFAAYHSKVEVSGPPNAQVLKFTRNWEINALTVPVTDFPKLEHLYGLIEHEEQQRVVLKQVAQPAATTTSAPVVGR